MPVDREIFINELKDLINSSFSDDNARWENFLSIVRKYQPVESHLKSIDDFNHFHNKLVDLLLVPGADATLTMDFSQYKQFELVMTELRRILENLIMEHCVISERLEKTEEDLADVKEELSDVKSLVYEGQYNRLCFSISTPLKQSLARLFQCNNARIDPLDRQLLYSLRDNKPDMVRIKLKTFERIRDIYNQLANDLSIEDYEDLVAIMITRDSRNVQEHELIGDYLGRCEMMQVEPKFEHLLKESQLTGLLKYKKAQMETLKKIFSYYVADGQYNIRRNEH